MSSFDRPITFSPREAKRTYQSIIRWCDCKRKFCSQQRALKADVERGTIIGSLLDAMSMSRTANLMSVSRTTVSRLLAAYAKLERCPLRSRTVSDSRH
ncbi:hypothetical protein NPIL_683551 [Nephila pilipes]|uniref:Uncharacterized protein n=1 Tax=Nephila pilipes TaxID=299642 RepID=A0A8X6TG94_NEPPI|nr:hypothetical protein NPIL_683551 [Nephila pilipes]